MPGRGELTIETLEPGDVLGWSWLFAAVPLAFRRAGARPASARSPSTPRACAAKCDDDPAFGYELMKRFAQVMIERLQATRLRLLDVYGDVARLSRSPARGPMVPRPFAVRDRAPETADTWTLEPRAARRRAAARSAPGQFMMLYAFGVGEVPISVSGAPDRRRPRRAHHPRRRRGDRGDLRARAGRRARPARPVRQRPGRSTRRRAPTSWSSPAGIGLAPLRPVVLHALEHRARATARSSLLYGARTPDDLLYRDELAELARRTRRRRRDGRRRRDRLGGQRRRRPEAARRGATFDPGLDGRRWSAVPR